MAQSSANLVSIFTDVANAIRNKKSSSAAIYPVDFADEIDSIQTGTTPTLVTKNITANGVYNASSDGADGYSSVSVSVELSGAPTLSAPSNVTAGTRTQAPHANDNHNSNGAFVENFVWTIGGVDVQVKKISTNQSVCPWLYHLCPLAGGSTNVTVKVTATNFNGSPTSSTTVTYAEGTSTTGYSSVSGLGTSTINTQLYTYDENFPRSFPIVQDAYGNYFIRIPTIYRKVLSSDNGQITGYALATSKLDSSYEAHPVFVDETNSNAILPYVLIGRWCCSSTTTANSVEATASSMTIAAGRTLCRARGIGYQQYDWKFQKVFTDLGVIISRMININNGQAFSEIMGIAHQQNYIWVDGVIKGSSDDAQQWYAASAEADYYSPSGTSESEATILSHNYTKLSYKSPASSNWITKLGYDTSFPFLNYPEEASGGSQTTYYCDYFSFGSGSRPVFCYVGGAVNDCGWFYCGADFGWRSTSSVRLCYRPIQGATGYTE